MARGLIPERGGITHVVIVDWFVLPGGVHVGAYHISHDPSPDSKDTVVMTYSAGHANASYLEMPTDRANQDVRMRPRAVALES